MIILFIVIGIVPSGLTLVFNVIKTEYQPLLTLMIGTGRLSIWKDKIRI